MNQHSGHEMHGEKHVTLQDSTTMVEWKVNPERPMAERQSIIRMKVTDAVGNAIASFATVHEKQMHLLAISRDLSIFQHLHPIYQGEGIFTVTATFPKGGEYRLFADFTPGGGTQQLATFELYVEGKGTEEIVHPDKKLVKTVDDLNFSLEIPKLQLKEHIPMIFSVKDQAGNPIHTLEPYLGSVGHVVIVSQDLTQFLHAHPVDESVTGPSVEYMTSFPAAGVYKIWGQFKKNGQVYTVPFTILVPDNVEG
ncbi:hypothetical protein ACQYAD_11085 [Neobacillus sp. SM06]|uniref:hypothetical protein n=1 Tax=Neobacillus sp. SM06 TaxID=3422492 RepID=UPI003D2777C0